MYTPTIGWKLGINGYYVRQFLQAHRYKNIHISKITTRLRKVGTV